MILSSRSTQLCGLLALAAMALIFGPLPWWFLLACAVGWPILDWAYDAAVAQLTARRSRPR